MPANLLSAVRRSVAPLGVASLVAVLPLATPLAAQQRAPVDAPHHTRAPISIGNYPNVAGLRINFRDRNLEQVKGVNATIWSPYSPATGLVSGLALGLPVTGAGDIHGVALALMGVGVDHTMRGIALAPIGVGGGGDLRGIVVGGIGVGTGGNVHGIAIGGIGAGAGGNATGLLLGGIGSGVGGNLKGISISGIGAGAGGNATGLIIGGIGSGTGGNFKGIALSGIGSGAGGNVTGLVVSGIGSGAGGTFHGVGIAGVGVGAVRLEGLFVAPFVGTKNANAVVIAPVLSRLEPDGSFRGATVSTVNYLRGTQRGLAIGLVNYARSLHGAQVGVINIVADAKSHPVLPIFNWGGH